MVIWYEKYLGCKPSTHLKMFKSIDIYIKSQKGMLCWRNLYTIKSIIIQMFYFVHILMHIAAYTTGLALKYGMVLKLVENISSYLFRSLVHLSFSTMKDREKRRKFTSYDLHYCHKNVKSNWAMILFWCEVVLQQR